MKNREEITATMEEENEEIKRLFGSIGRPRFLNNMIPVGKLIAYIELKEKEAAQKAIASQEKQIRAEVSEEICSFLEKRYEKECDEPFGSPLEVAGYAQCIDDLKSEYLTEQGKETLPCGCPRQDKFSLCIDQSHVLQKTEEVCKLCYGKKFTTQLQQKRIEADFPGDTEYIGKPEVMNIPCRCQKEGSQER